MNPVQEMWEWIAYSPSQVAWATRFAAVGVGGFGWASVHVAVGVLYTLVALVGLLKIGQRTSRLVVDPVESEPVVWDKCRCPPREWQVEPVVVSYPEFGLAPGYQETVGYVCSQCRGVVDRYQGAKAERVAAHEARARASAFALRSRVPEVCDCCHQSVFEPDHGGCSESGKPVVTVQTATVEEVPDVVAATLNGQGVAVHYDDTAGTVTITAREAVWDPCTGRYLGEIEEVRSWDGTVTATHIVR